MSEEIPRLLLVETSGRPGHVAVAAGAELLAVHHLDEARRQARDLAPAVGALLRGQAWTPRDLHAVVVSLGPGSYTGLRVGIMSAKALCYATGCAFLGVETFTAIAEQAPPDVDLLDVIADAQQEKVYVQSFRRAGAAAWESLSPLTIRTAVEWLAHRDPEAWVSGPGVVPSRLPSGLKVVEAAARVPQPAGLLAVGLRRYRAGPGDDTWSAEPIYLRPSAAEEQWRRLGRPFSVE